MRELLTQNMDGTMLIKKSFYFVRHGETDHNRQHICAGGGTDIPLNDTGQQQALSLKEKIRDLKISKVVSSPMMRALQTAELAYSGTIDIIPHLREWDLGDFEGQPVSGFIHFAETLLPDLPLPNGESKSDLGKRVISSVNEILKDHDDPVLIFSHGAVFWSLLQAIDHPNYFLENGELIHFQYQEERWQILKVL